MRRQTLAHANYYHVFSRGADKKQIFKHATDYFRFYACMYLFNDEKAVFPHGIKQLFNKGGMSLRETHTSGKPLVQILAFCLMSNHFHFLLEQVAEDGIKKFMHRLLMGYAKFFNTKYERTGVLFESRFKAVRIKSDAQLRHILRYTHLNALDRSDHAWRDGRVVDWKDAMQLLNRFPWSSHRVYMGKSQMLNVVTPALLGQLFPTPTDYQQHIKYWAERWKPGREQDTYVHFKIDSDHLKLKNE